MIQRLSAHVITLPRWFGLPVAVSAVVLGGIIAGASAWHLFLAVMAGVLLMAYAHSWNSFHDWVIGFDKGEPKERSKKKVYTSGQSLLALGIVTEKEVLANSLGWLVLSLGFAIPLSLMTTMWLWLPWGLVVLCAPWYSWAKKLYHCEVPLGLGFGSFAVMLGACAVSNPLLWTAFVAGLPITFCWGFLAETADQHEDWEVNWGKGLRNMGAVAGAYGFSIPHFIGCLVVMAYLVQVGVVLAGVLHPWSMLSLLSFPLFAYCILLLDGKHKVGTIIGLLGVFAFVILLTIGQGLGG